MSATAICLKCGAPLSPDARDGVCPKCLLALALASQSGEESADAAQSSPVITEAPGTIIGRYKLLEKIGEGGFGVVYMAEQEDAPLYHRPDWPQHFRVRAHPRCSQQTEGSITN